MAVRSVASRHFGAPGLHGAGVANDQEWTTAIAIGAAALLAALIGARLGATTGGARRDRRDRPRRRACRDRNRPRGAGADRGGRRPPALRLGARPLRGRILAPSRARPRPRSARADPAGDRRAPAGRRDRLQRPQHPRRRGAGRDRHRPGRQTASAPSSTPSPTTSWRCSGGSTAPGCWSAPARRSA